MRLLKSIVIDSNSDVVAQLSKFAEENSVILEIGGSSNSLSEAMTLIRAYKPELVFLDPTAVNLSEFHLIKQLDFNIPKFIFISTDIGKAYDAFRFSAADFQLKPLDFNELIVSLYKVIKLIEMELSFQNQKVNQIKSYGSETSDNGFIAISSSDKIELIKVEDIMYCKAEGKYTEFVLSNKQKILSSKNLGEYNSLLLNNYFFRIHHSYVVNIKKIVKIVKRDGFYCEFDSGISLPVAKRRQEEFVKFIKI
ncbi:MAG: DNA-binding response regulator [Flavobacteria bacterium GWF1_32_7]|nr:MAG: DNA-binding response regulator [Flavobacteria bacterium GWF1_32_7]